MNTPIITQLINGYDFFWVDEQIQIKVTRLDVHHDGRVTAEILVCTTKEGYRPTLMQPFQINFAALRTVEQTAKSLKASYPAWDWQTIMSTLAFKAQELARAGEPSQELWIDADEEVPEIEYLVYPLVIKNQPIIFYGQKEASKSTLACFLYISLMLPWYDNPLDLGLGDKPVSVLYLDWETDAKIFEWTMKRLRKGHNLPSFPVYYRRCNASLVDDIEDIKREIDKRKATVIIIDSIGKAAGGDDLEKAKPALDMYDALRKLPDVTPIMIGQTSKMKSGKNDSKSVFGCYSADTEVLTSEGWKPHPSVTTRDTVACFDIKRNCLCYEKPSRVWEFDYDGEMVHIQHGATDALITPNHKVYSNNHGAIEAEQLAHYNRDAYKLPYQAKFKPHGSHNGRMLSNFQLAKGQKSIKLNAWLKFIGYWISEGSIAGSKSYAILTQTEGPVLEEMKNTLDALQFSYKDYIHKKGSEGWKTCHNLFVAYDAGERGAHNQYRNINQKFYRNSGKEHLLVRWLKENCGEGAFNKRVPDFVWRLRSSQLKILFEALLEGDGHVYPDGHAVYTTASRQLADGVQRLAVLLGRGNHILTRNRKGSIQYEVVISRPDRKEITISPRNITREKYQGKVYCLSVPTGYYVTRRNGYVALLGNSTYFQYYARSIWEVVKSTQQFEDADQIQVACFHRFSNYTAHHQPLGYRINYTPTSIRLESCEVSIADFLEKVGVNAQLFDLLKDGAKSVDNLMDETGLKRNTIVQGLNRLRKKNKAIKLPNGHWGLLSDNAPTPGDGE